MNGAFAIAPILIPLAVAAVQLLLGIRFRRFHTSLSFLSCLALVAVAAMLMMSGSEGEGATLVYNLGNWPARFAIVLVVDRLSALMLLLTAVLALTVLPYALGRWQRMGPHFQPLVQLLLVGYNGAFLTGDLFNLFIFSVGGLRVGADPVLGAATDPARYADPLPHALVLTAIVIGFATTALFLVVLLTSRGLAGNDHVDGEDGTP